MSTSSDNPPFLPIGTEVSSKFRGAFCESTIVRIEKQVRVKFTLKEKPWGIKVIDDPNIPLSDMVVGKTVTIPVDKKQVQAQVNHVKDMSLYFVVFNDGDQKQLRRSQLVQKGERHFSAEAPVKRDRGSKPKANEPSTSRRVDDGNRGAEDRVEAARTAPTPRKRRAAENAMSAIGEMRGVINDTQSEESTDEQAGPAPPSTSKAKSRKRRQEEPEPMDNDEPAVNGGGPSTSAAANDQDRQQSAKEKKKKKKKEKEKSEQPDESDEENSKDLRRRERKIIEKLYRRYIKKSLDRNRKMLRQVLYRRSTQYSLSYRNHRIIPKKQRVVMHSPSSGSHTSSSNSSNRGSSGGSGSSKKSTRMYPARMFSFVSRYRIRNALLFLKWRNACHRIKTKVRCKYYRQWWKLPKTKIRGMFRNEKFVKNSERKSRFMRLFVGVEQEKSLQFVVLHDDVKKSRQLLKFVDKATEAHLTFDERCDLNQDDIACQTIRNHFKKETWVPGILLPKTFSVENARHPERVVRNMETGKLQRVWADDLVPVKWMPRFGAKETEGIVASRKAKNQLNFHLAWRFTRDYRRNRFHRQSLKAMLKCRRRTPTREFAPLKQRLKTKIAKLSPPARRSEPGAIEPLEEEPEEEDMREIKEEVREDEPVQQRPRPAARDEVKDEDESDYDSDYSIKNTPVDQRDAFVAVLLQFHDARNSILNSSPNIQGHDVDLFYLYQLALKIGGPRKIYSSNPWTVWGKKLVPQAVDPEEELKQIFKSCIENYLAFNIKMDWPAGIIQQRSERKQVQPGIYSENRKKRQKAQEAAAAGEPSTSQATPKNRPQYRKRKADTSESGSDRRRGSRNTTMSPGASEDRDAPGTSTAMYSDTEDDDRSQNNDGRVKRKKSKTPGRRSVSVKDEYPPAQPAKKGRPKKNVATVKNPLVLAKFVGDKTIDKTDEREYVRANLLSVIHAQDSLRAWHDGTWYKAHCVERCEDVTEDIKKLLMKIQRGQERLGRKNPLKEELYAIFDRLNIKAHYIGWNGRFDELLSYDYLKVLKKTQIEARKRFAILPNGKKLRPSILAVVERAMCQEDENKSRRPDYLKLAEEALGNESDFDTDDEPIEEKDRKKKKKERRRCARAIRATLMETTSESESESNNVRQPKKVKKRGAPGVDRDQPSSSRRRLASDDHSPEIGERSTTPSSKSSTSIISSPGNRAAVRNISSSPESVQSGLSPEPSKNPDESDEEDSRRESIESTEASGSRASEEQEFRQRVVPDDHSPELGVPSISSSEKSSSSSPQRRKTASPEFDYEGGDPIAVSPDDASRPPSKVPSKQSSEEPENVGESTEAAETASSKSTIKGAESDTEEPEYPEVLRTSEPADFPSPSTSSGNQNYPSLNRQGSSTAMPVFSPATTNLAHSGPLTLEEVPVVATTSSSAYDRKEEDVSDTEVLGKRRRTSAGVESTPVKRMRRASERSAGGTDDGVTSPRRHPAPLAPQPVSGALTLQMAIPESSGPIEPVTASTSKRRKTVAASPTFSTGPLVLDTSPPVASTPSKPPRPPGAPPLGRPKKNSAGSAASSRKTEERDEPRVSVDKVVSPSAGAGTSERRSAERRSATEEKEEDMTLNNQAEGPIGSPRGRGGKRKRGGRAGAVAAARVTPGRSSTSRRSAQEESEEKDAEVAPVPAPVAPPAPIAPPNLSRPDSFANQKARVAKYMEDIGTSQDFHLIGIDYEKVLRESPPEDININLEEMSNEARDLFYSAKTELAALEKMYRKVEAAKKKAAEAAAAEAVEADNAAPSSSEDPSTSSTPNNQ
ncbi:unnamed protein product [Caenorhabditis brenneri]